MKLWQLRKPWPWRYQRGWTTIWPVIWYSDRPASGSTLDHEEIHARQQLRWLVVPWLILYLFGPLPVLFNPFRYRAEWIACRKGSGLSESGTRRKLRSGFYGWLIPSLNEWALKLPPRVE